MIEGQAAVDQAKLRAQAAKIEADAELERLTAAREAELAFIKEQVLVLEGWNRYLFWVGIGGGFPLL